jgi:hypothetical protein
MKDTFQEGAYLRDLERFGGTFFSPSAGACRRTRRIAKPLRY